MDVEISTTDGMWKQTLQMGVETNTTDGCGNTHYRWVWKHTLQMGVETNGNKHYRWVWKQTETNATDCVMITTLQTGVLLQSCVH